MERSSSRGWRLAALVLLVALAGCGGLFGSGESGPGSTPGTDTISPAPVPTDTVAAPGPTATGSPADAAPTPARYPDAPSGIGAAGVVDRSELLSSHYELLWNRSYTVTRTDAGDRTPVSTVSVRVENRSTFHVVRGDDRESWWYGDPTGTFRRESTGADGEASHTDEVIVAGPRGPPFQFVPQAYLPTGNATVARVERDGRTFYRVHSTDPPADAGERVRNYSATVWVRADGLVRTVDATLDRFDETAWRHVDVRVTYADVGSTTVTEPDWVTRVKRTGPTVGPDGYPQGLDENGIESFDDLASAHRYWIASRSFTQVRTGDGAWSAVSATGTTLVENRTRFLIRNDEGADVYGDRTGRYRQVSGSGFYFDRTDPYWNTGEWHSGLRWLVAGDETVTRLERNGTTRFRVVLTDPGSMLDHEVENFTVTALVRPDGLVRRITVEARVPTGVIARRGLDGVPRNRSRVDVTYRYEYRRLGNTTVAEPDWVTRVKRNRTSARPRPPVPSNGERFSDAVPTPSRDGDPSRLLSRHTGRRAGRTRWV